jgi:SNF family Na+-dependent transporter
MSLKSKLKIEDVGMFLAFIFYAVVGIAFFVALPMANFPPHIGIIGIFSLITAYGLFMKRTWAIWFVAALFFIATTFSAITLYYVFGNDSLLTISMIAYLVLTWVFTVYALAKRKTLEGETAD